MRTVANLAQVIGSEPNYRAPVEKAQISDNATKLVDRMFQRLKALHPAWKQAFATTEDYNYAKQIWLEELLKAGVVTPLKLKRGLDIAATQASAFFPSVGQFIAWCNTTDYSTLGLPTPDELPARVSKFQAVYCTDGEDKFNYLSDAEYWLLTDLCSRGHRRNLKKSANRRSRQWQNGLKVAKQYRRAEDNYLHKQPCQPVRKKPQKISQKSNKF